MHHHHQRDQKKSPQKLNFSVLVFKMQICNLWTRVLCEVGYVGALSTANPAYRTEGSESILIRKKGNQNRANR